MMAMNRICWLHLALLSAVASTVMPGNLALAQRNDDADALPADRPRNSEPPRLMRGGIMQQLRSVTESVMGTGEDKHGDKSAGSRSANIPSPPPLGGQRRRAQPADDEGGDEPIARNPASRAPQSNSQPGQERAWAGQFLIPNYRLRDQVGTKASRPQSSGKRPPVPSDAVEMNLDDSAEEELVDTRPDSPPPRKPQGPPSPPRVYLGQRSPIKSPAQSASVQEELSDEMEEDVPSVPALAKPTAPRPTRTAKLPQPPPTAEDAVNMRLSDQAPTYQGSGQADEPTEVLVSHVPDIPYVPKKPVPKRERSKLLENTLKGQEATNSPRAGSSSSANKPSTLAPLPAAPAPSATVTTPTAVTTPTVTTPQLNAPPSTGTLPVPQLPTATPAVPTTSDPPSLPPNALTLDLSSTPQPQSQLASLPSLPSGSLPSGSLPSASLPSASLPSASLPTTTAPATTTPPALSVPSLSMPGSASSSAAPADVATIAPVPKRALNPSPGVAQPKTVPPAPSQPVDRVASIPSPPKSELTVPAAPLAPVQTSTPNLSLPSLSQSAPPALATSPSLMPSAPGLPTELAQPTAPRLPAQTVSTPSSTALPSGPATSTLPSPRPLSGAPTAAQPTAKQPSPTTSTAVPARPANQSVTNVQAKPPAAPPASAPVKAPAKAATSPTTQADVADTRMQMDIPHIQVKLLGPGDLTAGSPTTYELQVQNNDRIPLSGLILRMETPAGIAVTPTVVGANAAETETASDGSTLLTWHVSQVTAGGQARLPLQLNAQSARNFAVAIEWTVLPQSGVDQIVVKQADLQVALEGPVEVERNAANAYRVRVSNPGNAPARAVKLQVSAGTQPTSQIDVGDLAPGQTELIDMDLTFEKAGQVEIGVQAAAQGDLNRAANINVNVRQAILVASIALPESVPHGSPVITHVELSNTGDAPARKLQAGLVLPTGTQVAQLPAGVTRQDDKLLWDVEQVPPGQLVTIPLEIVLPTPGTHTLSFACVGSDGSVVTSNANINIEAFADLKLLVNDPTSPAPVGSPVTYELTITNRGSREAKGLVIVAQFSDGIEPESASGLDHRIVPGQVLFETLPQIAAGQSVTLKVVAKAIKGGVHRFRAEVRCDETEARLVEEESTRFLETPGRIATQPSATLQR